ncbi:hypothetical protein PRZ48_006510 [Zasmidium cellare]|uniref:USP domain-containing protein n=1 Tax=Zasmidium cellare TaxID=395010 RepID=A0ABR0EPQ9_ZASCE|nr:hypothetical protein PRZ48_006510 [Zasmidium cellare]
MASANTDPAWARDEAADANPDLTRKRQRLSEETETSPLSTDGDVVIEALPPDEIGTSFDNAIALDDDTTMPPFSETFILAPEVAMSAAGQFNWLCERAAGLPIDGSIFRALASWLTEHLDQTRDHDFFLDSYVDEHEFFGKLGQACSAILERQEDLLEPKEIQRYGVAALTRSADDFVDAVYELSSRVLRVLPSFVDSTIARRDSGQVSKTRQHLDLLSYVVILAQTLTYHRANQVLGFFSASLDFKSVSSGKRRRNEFAKQLESMGSLLDLLKKLAQCHREITNAWDGIDATLRIFNAVGLPSDDDERAVMDLAHLYILPVICEKHPRALPDNFHELAMTLSTCLLKRLATNADAAGCATLYESYIKSENDALMMESSHDAGVVDLLQSVSGGDHATLVELLTTAWTLARLKSFIYSDIMDVRSCGITLLSQKLLELYNEHRSGHDNFEHPVLQYVARFMRANELTKYIFGPNSHASLVNHSQNIIGFLAATFAYTNLESDIIWHACTNSVETEFVKASFTVLADLSRYLDLDHLLYLANKYAVTPPSKLGKDAVESLTDLFQKVQIKSSELNDHKHRLATAFISMDIMMRVANVHDQAPLLQLRNTARNELSRFATPAYNKDDRAQIFSRCIPNLLHANEHATTSVEIIAMFLPCIQTPQESLELLDMLPVQAVVEEVGQYVTSWREAEDPSRNATAIPGLQTRLDFVVRLMSLPGTNPDEQVRASLFRYTVGDMGLNNVARDLCWGALLRFLSFPELAAVSHSLITHFLEKEAFQLDLRFMTPQLIKLFGHSLQTQVKQNATPDDDSHILEVPAWQKLVQAAESVDVPQVSQPATYAICDMLFNQLGHSEGARLAAAKCHSDFARQQISHICDDFVNLDTVGSAAICQKISLLDAVLQKSRQSASSFTPGLDTDLCLATQPADELFQCMTQVYCGGHGQPKSYRLQANRTTTVLELQARLSAITGAAENRIIVGGKAIDLETQSKEPLATLGVQASGGILISPKHTMDSDLSIVLTPPGTVEQEVLTHFDDLERLLDGPDDVAQKAYQFLATIPPPRQVRQKVASTTTPVQELFPIGTQSWRSFYSLRVLDVHRTDFAKMGVADDEYIRQGVQLLVAVLVDKNRPVHAGVFAAVFACLTSFLQERPANAAKDLGIEEPSAFIDRVIDVCNLAVQCPQEMHEPGYKLLIQALRALFEASRMDNSIWQCFIEHPLAVQMHKNVLLLSSNHCVPPNATDATTMIKEFCIEERQPDNVANFYAKTLLSLLPDALDHRHRASHFFPFALEAIMASRALQHDEAKARGTMELLISTLRSYQHVESVDLPILDSAMLGLLKLLVAVIQVVKGFKKPLALSNLCTEILTRFLFPPHADPLSKPLVDAKTRKCAYELVQGACELEADFANLLDAAVVAMNDSIGNPNDKFPGIPAWLRPAPRCNGLINLGMTCYMNSLLQQLFANVHFRKFIFEVPIFDTEKQSLLIEVQKLFANMQDSYCIAPDTSALAKVLSIQTDSQEDVHGFYEDLLARLEANMPNDTWKASLNRFYTGKQLSQIKADCGHVSPKTEPFVDLPIIIKNKTGLSESLDEFVQGEPMEGANRYKCQACDSADGGRLVNAVRRACPEEIPNNLTFCLKRFTFEAMLGVEGKVNDRFEFPQTINMAPYKAAHLSDPTAEVEEDNFELVGVIVHQGTLHLGHYWSYSLLRNTAQPFSRTWVKLEDRNVSPVQGGIREVQHECFGGQRYNNGNERADNAYVLFYERRSSLEEIIAVPGPITDPDTGLLLPPKVTPPPHLAAEIHMHNAWRFRIGHLFQDEFAAYVAWLLEHYKQDYRDQRLAARKPAPSADSGMSSDAEGSVTSIASDEELTSDPLVRRVAEVAMTYLQRIAVCDPGRRLGACIKLLSSLALAQPAFAVLFIKQIIVAPKWFEKIAQHENKRVRTLVGDFVILCLKQILNHDQTMCERACTAVAQIHSGLMKNTNLATSLDWEDYLKFAAGLASLGQRATEIVLDSGYWEWVFNILYLPVDGSLRKEYPGVTEHFKTNPTQVSALYEFIYSILNGHVNLAYSQTDPELEGYYKQGPDGLVMSEDEIWRLTEYSSTGNRQDILNWIRASRWARSDGPWQDSAPGKLVGLLSSPKSAPENVMQIHQSLLRHIDLEEDHLSTLVSLAMHFCTNCDSEEHALPIFQTLVRVMPMWDGSNGEFLKILPDAYKAVPGTVIALMESWTPTFLDAKQIHRDEAAKWLQQEVFAEPISDSADLDAERTRQARKLIKHCDIFLRDAFNRDSRRSRSEAIIQLVYAISTYLQTLQAQVATMAESPDAEVSVKLRTEVDEIPLAMVVLKDLDADVLSVWQPDVVGVMQGASGQEVRASVEADEEFGSSDEEEWDDDDESVQLD